MEASSTNPYRASRTNPHIRLNSNTDDLLDSENNNAISGAVRSLSPRRPYTRSSLTARPSSSGSRTASNELLIPPRPQSRQRRYRDESPAGSPSGSPNSSRRSSWDAESFSSRDSRYGGPLGYPLEDSRPPSPAGSMDGLINTQTVAQKYNIHPYEGLVLFPNETEQDDWLHNPTPGEKDNEGCQLWSKRGWANAASLVFLSVGLLVLFIGYPVLTFVDKIFYPPASSCSTDPMCISDTMPLLANVRQGLIDPATPQSAMTRTTRTGEKQVLVFSDEFETPGRSFYENDDPYFQAVDLWYGVTQDLEWYDPDAITTRDGVLSIRFDAFQNHGLNYRSGMLQSWNQLCFKGGYIETSVSLPGSGDTSGFWPGFWTMGNLGRPGYASTTDGLWPYSYWDTCDYGITKNQSQTDGISYLPGMRLPACVCATDASQHPSPGNSRSAPEIDVIEGTVLALQENTDAVIGCASQSAQIAPFDIWYRPNYDFVEVYDQSITSINAYCGGPFQQALSAVTNLNNDWYDGKSYQKYGFEYIPGDQGYTTWFVGDDPSWTLDARALGPNGNIGQRMISQEPMSIIANLGMSGTFAMLNFTGLADKMPATMRLDYIRIYQGDNDVLGCDPPGYPTTEYIAQHPKAYRNREKLSWDSTGYSWPQNSYVDGCVAA